MKKLTEIHPQKQWNEPPDIRWVRVDSNTGKPSKTGVALPMVAGTEPGTTGEKNALGVLGVDTNVDSLGPAPEEVDSSALRTNF
jgi:hypothetical protein